MTTKPGTGADRYPLRSSRAFRWGMVVAVAVMMAIAIVLMFLLDLVILVLQLAQK